MFDKQLNQTFFKPTCVLYADFLKISIYLTTAVTQKEINDYLQSFVSSIRIFEVSLSYLTTRNK